MVAEFVVGDGESVAQVLERLEAEREEGAVRCVLLMARGEPSVQAADDGELRALTRFELPVVFAWEGELAAGAADLALAADVRVCGEGSLLRGPLVGRERALSLTDETTAMALTSGGRLSADDLLAAGLVSGVTAAEGAAEEGRRIASVIASRGPIATRLGKEAVWRGLSQPLEQALRFETDLTLLLQTTKDRAEGVRAFLEKRAPNFTGE